MLLYNGQKGCYESLSAQDGSDVPKIITNNTVGYKSPGYEEQTQEIKDKDEGM